MDCQGPGRPVRPRGMARVLLTNGRNDVFTCAEAAIPAIQPVLTLVEGRAALTREPPSEMGPA